MDIQMLLKAYKQLHDAEVKQKKLDKMLAQPLNYGIIRDLVNSAYNGVVISVQFSDGTKLDIKREDSFDRLQNKYVEGF